MKKFNQAMLIFSNSVEILFEELRKNLFSQGSSPFTKRVIIAPNRAMHSWIKTQLAQTLGIASGIKTCFLDQGINILVDNLFKKKKEHFIPSQTELVLRLVDEIEKALCEPDPIWDPLKKYLTPKERRFIPLVKYLAMLFNQYGVYGSMEVQEWEKKPNGWQEMLWKRIFANWDYPSRLLKELEEKESHSTDVSVTLFSFSHLAPIYFQFFLRVGGLIPLTIYHLSPCMEFWSDVQSDKERRIFKKALRGKISEEELENYLLDASPLLANLGKVGRKQARLFEESPVDPIELYHIPQGKTQLEKVQRDLLLMENRSDPLDDGSIQLHIAYTPYREIENLYNNLLSIFAEGAIQPMDVLVMAPDIALYESYIRAFFSGAVGFQIMDMPVDTCDPRATALIKLLELDKNRWSAPALMDLFNHVLFRNKMGWNEEDILQIREWVQATGIRWGVDAEHRNLLLKQNHTDEGIDDPGATWIQGITYLVEELAFSNQERERVDFTQAELLGEWAVVIEELRSDLALISHGTKQTLAEWILFLKKLDEKYLTSADENDAFYLQLKKFEKAARHFKETYYTFSSFFSLFRGELSHERITINPNQVQAVRFCSMIPMRAIPAKVICLLGMQHDAFPRKQQLHVLDLLKNKNEAPSRIEFDRYLFLEALLSAKEKLIISYLGVNPLDWTESPPASVVLELLPWISKKSIVRAPFRSYDPSYFNHSDSHLKNYSKKDFQMAQALNGKLPPPPFFIHRPIESGLEPGEYLIDLSDLQRLARSPLRHYFYHTLGLTFRDELVIQEEESFTLTPLQMAKIRKRSLHASLNAVIELEKRGEGFPLGIFGKLASRQIQNELPDTRESGSFHLLAHIKEATQKAHDVWHLPPIRVNLSENASALVIGRIDGVTQEGLLVFEKGDFKGAIKSWPIFLAYMHTERPFGKDALFFGRDGSLKSPFFASAKPLLKTFVEYYLESKKTPFPFFPEWISSLVRGDVEKLEDAVEKVQDVSFDPAVQWGLSGKSISARMLIEIWQERAQKVFGGLLDAWF